MRLSCTGMEIRGFEDFGVTSLTFWGRVTSSVMWPLDSAYVVFYWWSIGTMRISCTLTKILDPKDKGVTSLTFWGHVTSSITWPLDLTQWFPIGGPFEPSVYLAPLQRYSVSKIMGSRVWPFGVTWRHRSRDRRTRRGHFPISGQWWPCVYLAQIWRYGASKILGSRVWRVWMVTWLMRSRDHWTWHMWFPIGGPLEPCVYLAPLRSYKASKLHLPMLEAKISVRMRRATWHVGRGPK